MENAIVLNDVDLKQILAKHFNVPESKVLKSKYSYTVIGVKIEKKNED